MPRFTMSPAVCLLSLIMVMSSAIHPLHDLYGTFTSHVNGNAAGVVTTMESKSAQTRRGLAEAAKKGRMPGRKPRISDAKIRAVLHLGTAEGARQAGLSKSQFIARRRQIEKSENNDAE